MSEDQIDNSDIKEDELTVLKARADNMGIPYHPNIGKEKLKERLSAKVTEMLDAQAAEQMAADALATANATPVKPAVVSAKETAGQARIRQKNFQNELIRVRLTCMNPNKREWEGEILTSGNSQIGTFRKYIPFNVEYHVPRILFTMIQDRQCQVFYTVKDAQTGRKGRKGRLIKEFGVEVLHPLTHDEMNDLAQRQAIAGSIVT